MKINRVVLSTLSAIALALPISTTPVTAESITTYAAQASGSHKAGSSDRPRTDNGKTLETVLLALGGTVGVLAFLALFAAPILRIIGVRI
ncbi:hypothetical protein N7326_08595 [Corynebacterium sp. ES2794-CONJ1]|uniref:hypothetical protein n=1 Tax=unclassified Corynebacterium TaxID=2624378 RepID=UPI002169450B|nr:MULTISPECIES: hypothetical protein [unclassified Corynebacterium]MCS4492510.1 hypothetical protein [Corynebacterium sp. ES2715-CONJ3]MCS4532526.1 hypothetical protein [Corynebacterium sp. ES2730-CONJ]MCU9519921.1 hypothetical protein [Corynebacterium sp. ES2794-CONJ1]